MGGMERRRAGFVEFDLLGNAVGERSYTLTVPNIRTGWIENRSAGNKTERWVSRL